VNTKLILFYFLFNSTKSIFAFTFALLSRILKSTTSPESESTYLVSSLYDNNSVTFVTKELLQ